MPSAADIFQGVSGPTQGPFSQYLDPTQPVQPRPIDRPTTPATGYESGPVAGGKIALNFLQGIRQNRVADFLEQERNNQLSFNNYHQHASMLAQDPDLAPGGAEAILGEANKVLTQHMHREVREAPEHGALGVMKNIFTQMVGGKIPKSEPIDFEAEQGRLSNMARGYSQRQNFGQLVAEGQQAIEALKRGDPANGIAPNPNPPQEEVVRALAPTYAKLLQTAPNYAQSFLPVLSGGYYPAESYAGQSQALRRMVPQAPQTTPPPGATAALGPVPPEPFQLQIPGAATRAAQVRPADSGPPQYAIPLNSPERYAQLTGMAGLRNSRIAVSQRGRYITENGPAFTGHEISGSEVPEDNGVWNAETGQKVPGAIPMTAAGRTPYTEQGTGRTFYVDPFTGKMKPFEKEGGGEFKRAQSEGLVQMPDGSWQYVSKTGGLPAGAKPEAAAIAGMREAGADRRQRAYLAAARDRQSTSIDAADERDFRRQRRGVNATYDRMIASAKAANVRELNTQALQSGRPIPQNLLQGTEQNTKGLVDWLEQERKADLAAIDEDEGTTGAETTEPPPEASRTPKKPTPRTPPPPGAGKVVKGSSLLQ